MKHIVNYISRRFKNLNGEIFLYCFILLIFLVNTYYVSYPDEFVNLLGGQYINAGKIPYKEFFDHHVPFAWYLSAFFLKFSFGSYVIFRTIWALFSFFLLFFVGRYIKKALNSLYSYFLVYFFLFPFVTVYYWLHLFLADSLAFLLFSIIFWLLIVESYKKETHIKILYFISLLTFLFLFSSLTFIYVGLIFYGWQLYLLFRQKVKLIDILKFFGIVILPYIVYFIYLFLTGSLEDFYISNVVYNTKLYIDIPNYTKGRYFNPIKFALTIIFNFYQSYIQLLVHIKEFNLYFPFDLALALGTFMLSFFLFFENKILFFIYFFLVSLSTPRNDVLKIGESNYQVGIFIAIGFISAFIVFWKYKSIIFKEELLHYFKKICGILLIFYLIFASLFLIKNTYDKYYMRYTQKMPGIYDIAHSASFIDDVLRDNEYYWLGPYEPHEMFFVKKAKLPGKYISLLPQFKEDEYFKQSFLEQFKKNMPKIIVYKHEASIFMTPALEFGDFFVEWMKDKYTSIENIKGIKIKKSPSSFNIRTDLYLLNSEKEILLKRMREKNYIE